MSWFSDLAGKAEAFLERVDQATATTIQNVQSPSRDASASPNDDIDTHIGELHRISLSSNRLESTKTHATSEPSHSMVQTQPKPPKDLARIGHATSTPVKYFTPGASKQWSAPPTNPAALNNDSWLEYLNSPIKKQSSGKVAVMKCETPIVRQSSAHDDEEVDEATNNTVSNAPKEIPDVIVAG